MTPERTCVGCRARATQSELTRYVLLASVLTEGRDLPGRGAWMHARADCFLLATRKQAFGRALRFTGTIDSAQISGYLVGPDPT